MQQPNPPFVVARALETVIVRAWAGGRHKDETASVVDRDGRPGITRAGRRNAFRERVPAPAEPTGARLVSPHLPARAVDPIIVGDRGTNDDEVIGDRRWGGFLVFAATGDIGNAAGQVDLAADAKVGTWLPRRRVNGEQPRIDGRQKDSPVASIALGSRVIGP